MNRGGVIDTGSREGVRGEEEARLFMEMSNELYALARAKEILEALEQQGRITDGLREAGVVALSAAIMAIEQPAMRHLGHLAGMRAADVQAARTQDAKKRLF